MHWLERQVARLNALSDAAVPSETATRLSSVPGIGNNSSHARARFLDEVRKVVGEVSQRRGVTACFACHDGLILDAAGRAPDFEALAAVTQTCLSAGKDAATALALGRVRQLVIVGDEHKLALLLIGQFGIGIVSPKHVELAAALAQ